MDKPFTATALPLVSRITYCTFFAGFSNIIIKNIFLKLSGKGYHLDQTVSFLEDGSTYLIMAVILTGITLILKKGIVLHTDNDLTL